MFNRSSMRVLIVNVGNHYLYHKDTMEMVKRKVPGLRVISNMLPERLMMGENKLLASTILAPSSPAERAMYDSFDVVIFHVTPRTAGIITKLFNGDQQ